MRNITQRWDEGAVAALGSVGSETLARKALSGGLVMIVRQIFSIVASFIGGVVLARYLTPAEFGAYALLLLVSNLLAVLTDLGLGATLVRQSEQPRPHEVRSVFTAQAVITLLLVPIYVALLPLIAHWDDHVTNLALALGLVGLGALGLPFMNVGFAVLESRLAFRGVGMALMSQTLVFNVVACVLAIRGAGILSVGVAFAVSNLWVGLVACVAAAWVPRVTTRVTGIRERLRFGLPFSGSSLVSIVKDSITPLFIGLSFGASAAGYINWAQTLAVVGMLMLFPLVKVFFPIFARLRHDPEGLRVAVVRAAFWSYALAAPVTLFIVVNVRSITSVLYGEQWLPAVGTVLWLSSSNLISPLVNVLFVVLNVQGQARTTFAYTLAYLVGTWVLVPVAATLGSYHAYGWANLLVTCLGLPLVIKSRTYLRGHVIDMVRPWVAATVGMAFGRLVAGQWLGGGDLTLLASAVVGGLTYLGLLYLLGGRLVREAVDMRRQEALA